MPPSGYSFQQANRASEFLVSCGQSLVQEAADSGFTAISALKREIENIDRLLAAAEFSEIEKSLFRLNRSFYRLLLDLAPATLDELGRAVVSAGSRAEVIFLSVENRTEPILRTGQSVPLEVR